MLAGRLSDKMSSELGYYFRVVAELYFLEVSMKNTKVTLVPLTPEDREQFILDNQWAFKHGALLEFSMLTNVVSKSMNLGASILSRRSKCRMKFPMMRAPTRCSTLSRL